MCKCMYYNSIRWNQYWSYIREDIMRNYVHFEASF